MNYAVPGSAPPDAYDEAVSTTLDPPEPPRPEPNKPPVPVLIVENRDGVETTIHYVNEQITLDAINSHDPDGTYVSIEWYDDEGFISNEDIYTVAYSQPGEVVIELQVQDAEVWV